MVTVATFEHSLCIFLKGNAKKKICSRREYRNFRNILSALAKQISYGHCLLVLRLFQYLAAKLQTVLSNHLCQFLNLSYISLWSLLLNSV